MCHKSFKGKQYTPIILIAKHNSVTKEQGISIIISRIQMELHFFPNLVLLHNFKATLMS